MDPHLRGFVVRKGREEGKDEADEIEVEEMDE
jgi:hypothetical protein